MFQKIRLKFSYIKQGRSHWWGQGVIPPFPHFNFRTKQGPIASVSKITDIAFTGIEKLNGPEISRFLPCMLQFLDNVRRLSIFSNYIGKIDHFTLDLLKRSDT